MSGIWSTKQLQRNEATFVEETAAFLQKIYLHFGASGVGRYNNEKFSWVAPTKSTFHCVRSSAGSQCCCCTLSNTFVFVDSKRSGWGSDSTSTSAQQLFPKIDLDPLVMYMSAWNKTLSCPIPFAFEPCTLYYELSSASAECVSLVRPNNKQRSGGGGSKTTRNDPLLLLAQQHSLL